MQTVLAKPFRMIGFTGSDLRDSHAKAIEKVIGGPLIKMNINNIFKPPAICHGVEIFDKISDFRNFIASVCT